MPRSVASHKNKLKERFFSSGDFAAGLCRWWSQSGLLSDEDLRRSGHGGSNIPGVVSSLSCCQLHRVCVLDTRWLVAAKAVVFRVCRAGRPSRLAGCGSKFCAK